MQTIKALDLDIDSDKLNEKEFYKFFETKKLKLIVAIVSAFIGVLSNYSAIKYQLGQSRFDMVYLPVILDIYAIGVTLLLDVAIIVFSLMRLNVLTWLSAGVALIISIYANIQLMFQTAGGTSFKSSSKMFSEPSFVLAFMVNMSLAILPIIILKYIMIELMSQLDNEDKV